MQMYVVHTYEIDDAQDAVQEILQALPLDDIGEKPAVGLMTCHTDAVLSGVVSAICEALPFDVIGMTTLASCGDGQADISLLTLVVLVSEEITFACALSRPLGEDSRGALRDAYAQIQKQLTGKPALCCICAPFSREISGQEITSYFTEISDNVPLFGGMAASHTVEAESTFVFHNGQAFEDVVALLCFEGPVKPRFNFISLRPDALQRKKAIITASEGNTVFSVNDMPVMNYIYSLGLSSQELRDSGTILPFLVDYNDGTPMVAREVLGVTSEKHLNFGGAMPTGASIYLALQNPGEILETAQSVLADIQEHKENTFGALVMGCGGRSVILGGNLLAEAHMALDMLHNTVSFHQSYCRGEICPVVLPHGGLENRFHNFSITVCMFEKA